MTKKRRQYTDEERASACALLEANGYPDKKGALTQTSNSTGVALSTLRGWFHEINNAPPAELRNEKRVELKEILRSELTKTIEAMDGKRGEALYSSLSWTMAVIADKLIVLDGDATSRVDNKITIKVEYDD